MSTGEKFEKLVSIMSRLRGPDGCPWDREQNFDTIKPYLLEETYEVLNAIDSRDWAELADELGDLMLQAVFFAQMASEAGHFRIDDSLDAINAKLIRRHPHIFGDSEAQTADDVKKRWDEIKKEEKAAKGAQPELLLDSISRAQPALAEATHIHSRAARAGFDWVNLDQVIDKLHEEVDELRRAQTGDQREHEVGDLLGVVVNLARFLSVDPEQALRKANARFRRRFSHVEKSLSGRGKKFSESNIDEMEELWLEAKRAE